MLIGRLSNIFVILSMYAFVCASNTSTDLVRLTRCSNLHKHTYQEKMELLIVEVKCQGHDEQTLK